MINGNRLIFGYGTVGVGLDGISTMVFTHIKPPKEIGERYDRDTVKEFNRKVIHINHANQSEFGRLINGVSEYNPIFEFCGLIFDFSKYNEKSVNVVKNKFEIIISSFMYNLPFAC